MRNLTFGFFDDSGMPRESRILMFYSFETDENLPRSGILHYHIGEGRFVGPRHDQELIAAALAFLTEAGRLPSPTNGTLSSPSATPAAAATPVALRSLVTP